VPLCEWAARNALRRGCGGRPARRGFGDPPDCPQRQDVKSSHRNPSLALTQKDHSDRDQERPHLT